MALSEPTVRAALLAEIAAELERFFAAAPIVDGKDVDRRGAAWSWCCARTTGASASARCARPIRPRSRRPSLRARGSAHAWDRLGGPARAQILDSAADLYERDRVRLMAVMVREAGKTLDNALGDVREAVDFLRYYAARGAAAVRAARLAQGPDRRDQPAGAAGRAGRSPASSPWNFPLAIFTGQVAAALAAGNPVLAKPAEQTPITAFLAVQLLHEAGVPPDVLHLLPGAGEVGAALVKDPRVAGVAFTGSNATGWADPAGAGRAARRRSCPSSPRPAASTP